MYFTFSCSACGKTLKVREENAGRRARCPYCHATVVVPERGETTPTTPQIDTGPVSAQIPTRRKTKTKARPDAAPRGVSDGTNVSMLWTALAGFGATVVFMLLLYPLSGTYLRALFYERSWVTPTEAFFLFWSIAILVFKSRKLLRQRESMLFDVLPDSLSADITLATLDKFTQHVRSLPVVPAESFLIQRVLRGLEHFRVRRSASETATMLASQSEIDNVAVQSSYAILNVFIWAIPILGFIGTVQGLGSAVGELSGSLEQATSVNDIKGALQGITTGLGTAFDTTLIALIMALLLKFPASSLQKAEEDLLNSVDEYCNENLLRRLKDSSSAAVSTTGEAAAATGQLIEAVSEQMKRLVEQHEAATRELTEHTNASQQEIAAQLRQSAESLHRYTSSLEKGLQSLNRVLAELGQKTIVIESHELPRRRWRLFSRNDGADE